MEMEGVRSEGGVLRCEGGDGRVKGQGTEGGERRRG